MPRSPSAAWVAFAPVPLLVPAVTLVEDLVGKPTAVTIEHRLLLILLPLLCALAAPAIGRFADARQARGLLLVAGTLLVLAPAPMAALVPGGAIRWLLFLMSSVGGTTVAVGYWATLAGVAPPGARGRLAMLGSAAVVVVAPIALILVSFVCWNGTTCALPTGTAGVMALLALATLPTLLRSHARAEALGEWPVRGGSYGPLALLREDPVGRFLVVFTVGVAGLTTIEL